MMSDHRVERPTTGAVWLVGVQLDPERDDPEVYTLLIEAKNEQPIVNRGRIVLFSRPELAPFALRMEEETVAHRSQKAPEEISTVYQLGQALSLIRDPTAEYDDAACIVNCLNLLFDCIVAIRLTVPTEYRELLHMLADHLTFSKSLNEFDRLAAGWREQAFNGILWCLGAVCANSLVLTSPEPHPVETEG